jgi:hypothetical protein
MRTDLEIIRDQGTEVIRFVVIVTVLDTQATIESLST